MNRISLRLPPWFTIRDMMWLTLVACLVITWRTDTQRCRESLAAQAEYAFRVEGALRLARHRVEGVMVMLRKPGGPDSLRRPQVEGYKSLSTVEQIAERVLADSPFKDQY